MHMFECVLIALYQCMAAKQHAGARRGFGAAQPLARAVDDLLIGCECRANLYNARRCICAIGDWNFTYPPANNCSVPLIFRISIHSSEERLRLAKYVPIGISNVYGVIFENRPCEEAMRYSLKSFSRQQWISLLRLAVVAASLAGFTQNALADEMPEGMFGWWYLIAPGEAGYAPDPVTACKLTAKNHHSTTLFDIKPYGDAGTMFECKYLHRFPAVNEINGPQWYSATFLRCHSGYFPRSPGVCVKRDEPPPPSSCKPGTPGFALGNPVTVSTGAKVQDEIDFAGTRAGALQITRTYRPFSQFISGQSAGTNWSFSFGKLLTIQRWSSGGRPLSILGTAGDESHFSFFWNATKGEYESTLDKTATLVPLSPNYDEWLMVKNGRADRFKATSNNRPLP